MLIFFELEQNSPQAFLSTSLSFVFENLLWMAFKNHRNRQIVIKYINNLFRNLLENFIPKWHMILSIESRREEEDRGGKRDVRSHQRCLHTKTISCLERYAFNISARQCSHRKLPARARYSFSSRFYIKSCRDFVIIVRK